MRRAIAPAVVALAMWPASAAGGAAAGRVDVPVPLPPRNSVSVAQLVVSSGGPIRVVATNQAQLGGRQLNTQVVAGIKKSGKTTTVWILIHRFSPVYRRVAGLAHAATLPTSVDIEISGPETVKLISRLDAMTCFALDHVGWTQDTLFKKISLESLVQAMDSPPEEQVDGAIATKCPGPGTERPDAGQG